MTLSDALRKAGTDVLLDLEVVPGAGQDAFPSGFNPWRNRVQARVQAPPQEGEANQHLVRLATQYFQAPVHIESGATSRQKRLRIMGADLQEIHDKLERSLANL